MAQISYGTITITDTTDIESIVVEYAQNQDPLTAPINGWGTTRPGWAEGYYIWQRTRTHKYGTSSSEDDIGTAVCITGSPGESGKSLSSSTTQYTIATSSAVITTSNMGNYTWYNNIPTYDNSRPAYWVRVTNIYTNPSFESTDVYNGEVSEGAQSGGNEINSGNDITTVYIIYKDEGLSSAVSMSYEALDIASNNINSITRLWYAQANATPVPTINTIVTDGAANRYNAWSNIRPTDNSNYPYYFYCDQTISGDGVANWSAVTLDTSTLSKYEIEATNVRTKNFFKGQDNTYDGWFASGRSTNEGLNESDATTYYYNARFAATNITLGYNKTPVIDIDGGGGAINIYRLPTINSTSKLVTAAGTLGAKLNSAALTFYNTSGIVTSSFGDSISLASNGASITIGSTSTGKYNTYIDSQGLYLRTGTTSYATLNSNGLTLSKGGIRVNPVGSNGGVYISSENLGTSIALDNNNRTNWRAVIGSKFGVDSEGNLYGASVKVTGDITASSMTINPNAAISDPGGLLSNDAIEIGGRNLMVENTSEITEDQYLAAKIYLTEPLEADQTYILQLWNVDIINTEANDFTIGVNIYYCGDLISFGGWSKKDIYDGYFQYLSRQDEISGLTINYYHADYLILTFTPHSDSAADTTGGNQPSSGGINNIDSTITPFINIYNSFSVDSSGTKDLIIGQYKLEKGNKPTNWTLAPEDSTVRTDELENDLSSKTSIEVKEISGSLVTFEASEYAAIEAIAEINPKQEGSGDPSSSNIRPISGWDRINIYSTGNNLFGEEGGKYFYLPLPAGTQVTISKKDDGVSDNVSFTYNSTNTHYGSIGLNTTRDGRTYGTTTLGYNTYNFIIYSTSTDFQVKIGTDYTYEPYGQTYTVLLGQTVYGGTIDFTRGFLTVTHKFISSYDGTLSLTETEWISDRAVYSSGNNPPIGSQVVYKLEIPEVYNIIPQIINLNSGINNVWTDVGNISLKYAIIDDTTLDLLNTLQETAINSQIKSAILSENLDEAVNLINQYLGEKGYIYAEGDKLVLGKGIYKAEIDSDSMVFKNGSNEMVRIDGGSNSLLTIRKTNVGDEMRMGNFIWTIRDDKRLVLKYDELV